MIVVVLLSALLVVVPLAKLCTINVASKKSFLRACTICCCHCNVHRETKPSTKGWEARSTFSKQKQSLSAIEKRPCSAALHWKYVLKGTFGKKTSTIIHTSHHQCLMVYYTYVCTMYRYCTVGQKLCLFSCIFVVGFLYCKYT